MVVMRYVTEAAEALHAPYGAREILTNLNYDSVIEEWRFNWQCLGGPSDSKIWGLKICGWLQYKYPGGPAGLTGSSPGA